MCLEKQSLNEKTKLVVGVVEKFNIMLSSFSKKEKLFHSKAEQNQ